MSSKRVGDAEREVTAKHLREAFAKGYLKYDEMLDRISTAAEATRDYHLTDVVKDLPSTKELATRKHGRLVASKERFMDRYEEHPVLALLPVMVLSLIVLIVPTVALTGAYPNHMPFGAGAAIALCVIAGMVGLICSFVGMLMGALES